MKPFDKILLLTAKLFLFRCCYLHWKVKCRMSSKVREADYILCSRCPLLTFGSVWFMVTWGQDDLSDYNYMTSNSVDLLRSFLLYTQFIYQISKTNGQWQQNLNEMTQKKLSLCAHTTATTTIITSKHTQTHKSRWKPSWVLTIGSGLTALWWHLIPSIAFLLLMVWGASTHCLTDIGKLVDTHRDTRTPVQPNICCF